MCAPRNREAYSSLFTIGRALPPLHAAEWKPIMEALKNRSLYHAAIRLRCLPEGYERWEVYAFDAATHPVFIICVSN